MVELHKHTGMKFENVSNPHDRQKLRPSKSKRVVVYLSNIMPVANLSRVGIILT